jgi:hypothetical protein
MSWRFSSGFFCAVSLSWRIYSSNKTFPRDLELVIDFVRNHLRSTRGTDLPIAFHPRKYNAKIFFGTVEETSNKVDIYYDAERNRCWKRFIVTKELCQLFYESPNSQHLASSPDQVDSLIRRILAGLAQADHDDHPASSEEAAVLMAIEMLLPHSERNNVNNLIASGCTGKDIAKHYLLPEQMVSLYLDKEYSADLDKAVEEFKKSEKYKQEHG